MTDVGTARSTNEDQFLVADLKKSAVVHQSSLAIEEETSVLGSSKATLLIVADGVGGAPGGARASRIAVSGAVHYLLDAMHWMMALEDEREGELFRDLRNALQFSQARIASAAAHDHREAGMGTTITLAYLVPPNAYLVHVGDSRAYLLRGAAIHQLTRDQTVAQMLADRGIIEETDVPGHPFRHVLGSLMGCTADDLQPELHKVILKPGDRILLCTDGLTRELDDSEIAQCLRAAVTAESACRELIQRTNAAGGRDNTTAVAAFAKGGSTVDAD